MGTAAMKAGRVIIGATSIALAVFIAGCMTAHTAPAPFPPPQADTITPDADPPPDAEITPTRESALCFDEASDPDFEGYSLSRTFAPDESDVEILAKTIYGEARGVTSEMERAAVVWCILNRVDSDDPYYPDTISEVVRQPLQFNGYSPDYPATEESKALVRDVLTRWEREKLEGGDVGRVLPKEYLFFTGDGKRNRFRTEYNSRDFWDWTLPNPYEN